MSYHADLTTETDVASGAHVRAIGWLAKPHEFKKGSSSFAFIERLGQFVAQADRAGQVLGFPVFMGAHQCEFCGRASGIGNIAVVGESLVFVAPELVLHYVTAHEYLPPAEFVDAVLLSPLPESSEFRDRVDALYADAQAGLPCPRCGKPSLAYSEEQGAYAMRCHSCSYREEGTVSYPVADEDLAMASLLVRCKWPMPTPADLGALRSVFPLLAGESLSALRDRLRDGAELLLGPFAFRVAHELQVRASSAGLIVKQVAAKQSPIEGAG